MSTRSTNIEKTGLIIVEAIAIIVLLIMVVGVDCPGEEYLCPEVEECPECRIEDCEEKLDEYKETIKDFLEYGDEYMLYELIE